MVPTLSEVERAAADGALVPLLAREGSAVWACALRVDAAIVQRFPELAFPCLWNRCSAEPAAHELLAAWRDAHGARPWLRALRPPRYPVGSGLIEEYRADFGALTPALRITDRSVFAGEFAWDRTTARPTTAVAMASNSAPSAASRTDAMASLLAASPDDFVQVVAVAECAATGRSFVGGCFDAYVGVVVAVSSATGAGLWRVEGGSTVTSLAARADGSLVVAGSDDAITAYDGATGAVRFHAPISATAVALTDDGQTLATLGRSERVVRVWDVAALHAAFGQRRPDEARTGSGCSACFTPDGTRVLTGGEEITVWDAADGRAIARLTGAASGRFLEGGPPDEDAALSDRYYAEFQVFRGRRVWELATGACIVPGADGHYLHHRDRLRTSRADRFAHAIVGGDTVTVYDVVTREPLLAVTADDLADFRLAADGAWLDVIYRDGSTKRWELGNPIFLPETVPEAATWRDGLLALTRAGTELRVVTNDPLVFNAPATRAASRHALFAWEPSQGNPSNSPRCGLASW